jgi:peroxiredoxin
MVELGQLEARHADFDNQKVRIVAVSPDNLEESKKTQEAFPHLQIVSDAKLNMADAMVLKDERNRGPGGVDTNTPTTILVDGASTVRWIGRPDRFLTRLTPDDLLKAVDEHLAGKGS